MKPFKKRIIIATVKPWNISNAKNFILKNKNISCLAIKNKRKLDYKKIKKFNPDYIFFPHWSWDIPEDICTNFNCVVFHMTDLPFGRGGNPLQNLIQRGLNKTKISAFKAIKERDAGPIYIKRDLLLHGSAESIYRNASQIIFEKMIPFIIKNGPKPYKQTGKVTYFRRRTPKDSEINDIRSINELYHRIRMLDAPGYPRARIKMKEYIITFRKAKYKNNKLTAEANFEKRGSERKEKYFSGSGSSR